LGGGGQFSGKNLENTKRVIRNCKWEEDEEEDER
jgi:hypothetical protein